MTGANGFIAKNLIEHLKRYDYIDLYLYTKKDSISLLEAYVKEVEFIFHLAGVNRPTDVSEFYKGNSDITKKIVDILMMENKKTPVLLSSSTQAILENDYGKSKLKAENILLEYSKNNDAPVFIYRLQNVFGKWCKPNYNSVIATWCNNIANDLEIQISDKNLELDFIYIDDVIDSFVSMLNFSDEEIFFEVDIVYKKTLGEIKELLYSFKYSRDTLMIPEVGSGFERSLYATYLSYLSNDNFSYELKGHKDDRGTFYEMLKTKNSGQISISTTAPGVARGGHFHHTKNEKFLVLKGIAVIQLRNILSKEIVEYKVSDEKMEVVEMIPGYTHNIKNIGDEELVLLLWANEIFDKKNPDTYYLEV